MTGSGTATLDSEGSRICPIKIPSINMHILEACNMRCHHCYATNIGWRMSLDSAKDVIRLLADYGSEKINFAGGEPLLHTDLREMIMWAKECKMTTSIVTNGSLLNPEWIAEMSGYLDWLTLSIDSSNPETHKKSGRFVGVRPMSSDRYLEIAKLAKMHKMRLKINSVVTRYNCHENMASFIKEADPERWKIMQVLSIRGQNDDNFESCKVTLAQFHKFVDRHRDVERNGIVMVPEDNDSMAGSYVMIDPDGCFLDNTCGTYRRSRPILEVGMKTALGDVSLDAEKFKRRGGLYDW